MSIGETLADARLHAGLTVSQVSQQTRIRESIIRDIEQDDFSSCGGDFYARGHIRSIANAVGTDPVPLISAYDEAHGPVSPLRAAEVFEPAKPIKIRERRSPSLAMFVVLVLLAIIGFAAYRLVSGHGSTHPTAAASSVPPSISPTPVARASASPSPSPSPTVSGLVIKVDGQQEECWVQLSRASDGAQIYAGVVAPGSSMTWHETDGVSLRLGNPGGVTVTVNGQRQNISTVQPVTLDISPGHSSSSPSVSTASGSQAG
jgi:cytoskeletal protein RodZ